jgi:hypothetical protein
MPHLLQNKTLKIVVDLPQENYRLARFDWTGKIVSVKFNGTEISGQEKVGDKKHAQLGKGFYNEFGIVRPIGFEATKVGGWFHKIGVGLLKKEDDETYAFGKTYKIKPAAFKVQKEAQQMKIQCIPPSVNGYGYILHKEIRLLESGFQLQTRLENTGEKTIATDEYNHNFLAIDSQFSKENYRLKFPFDLDTNNFEQSINPENSLSFDQKDMALNAPVKEPFFFSDLSGGKAAVASWELTNLKQNFKIREEGSFQTNKVNVWGWKEVLSPELFCEVLVKPGHAVEWSRTYSLSKLG